MRLRIADGTIYDPANNIDGRRGDLWIEDGRIVAPPADPAGWAEQTIDAHGYVVMPGGIDMHCHIAGPKVNAGRRMTPELKRSAPAIRRTSQTRSGTSGPVPSSFATGYLFAGMGYTTAFDAAIPGLLARHAHEELQDTPILDKGFYMLFGNNHYVMDCIRENDEEKLDAYCAWGLNSAKGYTTKIVNPGGVENWKQISRKTLRELDEPVERFGVTPRQIVRALAGTTDRLKLPHSVHIHCNNLGIPGNWQTTLRTMEALEGHRGHFAHIQYHSYDGREDDPLSFASATTKLIEYVRDHTNVTIDVGHVNAGKTLSMTGDAPFSRHLHRLTHHKWFAADCEQESSCGVIPIEYRPQKSLIHAVQWAISLEWYLLMDDPWRIAMSSDHPNGGAFIKYPEIIHLLMDRGFREAALQRLPQRVRENTVLAEIDREYTLNEIAIITRAAPARILGLSHKGHLGEGADADVTIYSPREDYRAMFERPRWVIKSGQIVAEDGEIKLAVPGKTMYVEPKYDRDLDVDIQGWFEQYYTIGFRNYPVDMHYLPSPEKIGCGT